MANTQKTPKNMGETVGANEEDFTLTPEDRENEDTEAMIAAEFGQGDANVTWAVKVYRAASKGEPEPYLFTCSPSELPVIDRLRDQYGTGLYRVRVFKNNRVYRYFSVSVEALKAPPAPVVQPPPATDNVIAQALQRQSDLIERLLTERRQPVQTAPAVDPVAMIASVFGIIGQVKGLFAPQQTSNAEQTIDLFLKGVDAAKELGGGKGESSMTDIIRDLLKSPIVENILKSATEQPPVTALPAARTVGIAEAPPPPMQPPQQPQPPQGGGNNETTQQHGNPPDQQLAAMMHNLRYLATKAAAGADVGLYADWVIDNAPREMLEQMTNEPNALALLAQMVPETAPYQTWFAELLGAVKEYLTEDAAEPQDTEHVQPRPTTGSVSAS